MNRREQIGHELDAALAPMSEGRPDAIPTRYSQRMASILDTVLTLLGEPYAWGNAWDEYPVRCRVVFNVSSGNTHSLFCESHRNLHLWTDVALIRKWLACIRLAFEGEVPDKVYLSTEDDCI